MTYREAFAYHRYLLGVCFVYMAIVVAVSFYLGVDAERFAAIVSFFAIMPVFYLPVLMAVCFGGALRACLTEKMPAVQLLPAIMRRSEKNWDEFLQSGQAKNGFAGLLAISPLLIFFCIIKSLFPVLAPFQMDATFAEWDHALHGAYPHTYLIGWISSLHFGSLLEQIYVAWFLFMFGANFYCLFFDGDHHRRKQYLWSFTLCWILSGTVMALLLYSAGPVYYHLIHPDVQNPYADLMAWLSGDDAGKPPNTLTGANILYNMAHDGLRPDINGPSAMPSQHVGIAWLLALYAFRIKPLCGWLMTLYTLAILLASVALGWHYAVDGYVGIIVATAVWFAVGVALKQRT